MAAERQAKTYCIVISARGPNEREMEAVEDDRAADQGAVRPEDLRLPRVCSLPEQARAAQACGVDRVNHNLNTSEEFYGEICSTHSYGDRVDTLEAVRNAGMELCSGGIIGMGEKHADVVQHGLRSARSGAPNRFR